MNLLQNLFSAIAEKLKGAFEAIQDRIKYGSSGGGMAISAGGIREMVNRNPLPFGIVIGVIVLGGLGYAVKEMFFSSDAAAPSIRVVTQWYYSADDGATYFPDAANKVAPFDKDGKPAVRAHVFACDDGKKFVGYIERQTAKAERDLDALPGGRDKASPSSISAVLAQDREVRLPKAANKEWFDLSKPNYAKITAVKCADDKSTGIEEVFP